MKNVLLACLVLIGANFAIAQSDKVVSLDSFSIATEYNGRGTARPAVSLLRRADHVAVTIEVGCDLKKAEDRIAELQRAVKQITDAAGKASYLKVTRGQIRLTPQNRTKYFSSSGSDTESTAEMVLLGSLADGASVYQRTAQIKSVLDGVGLSEKVRLAYGPTGLGVDNPGQYRAEILQRIAADVKLVRETFGKEAVFELTGVDGRVNVAQVDEENVDLFISYGYSVQLGK